MQHTLCSIATCVFLILQLASLRNCGMVWHCCQNDFSRLLYNTEDRYAKKTTPAQKVFLFNTACFVVFFTQSTCIISHDDTMNEQLNGPLSQCPRSSAFCVDLHAVTC